MYNAQTFLTAGEFMTTDPQTPNQSSRYRWVMLAICTLTPMLAVTLPNMSLPPMFKTISDDLGLTLVEVGTIWGSWSLTAIFVSLPGGTLGDRFGTRRVIVTLLLLSGVFGMSRSLAVDFTTLLITSILSGVFQAIIPVMVFKVIRQWFPTEQLGMASGVISAGFASGLMLGPLISTSVILPAMGGWRQVLVLFGGIAIALSVVWLFVHPAEAKSEQSRSSQTSLGQNLRHVIRLRNLWIIGIGGLGINACFNGFTGYLPTYLKTIGWAELDADQALAAFFLTSLIAVVPLSILSDRLHLRRGFLIIAGLILSLGISSLALVDGSMILLVVAATGFVFDGFMAILNASS